MSPEIRSTGSPAPWLHMTVSPARTNFVKSMLAASSKAMDPIFLGRCDRGMTNGFASECVSDVLEDGLHLVEYPEARAAGEMGRQHEIVERGESIASRDRLGRKDIERRPRDLSRPK